MDSVILLVLVTAFHRTKRSYQYLSALLFAIGVYVMISCHASPTDWLRAALPSAGIVCLLITVPLLGITLYFEPYLECLREVMPRYVKTPFQFFTVTALFGTLLSSLLNIAAIPFLYRLFVGVATQYPSRLFHHALARGVCINMLWSPSYISVAVVMQYMNLTWGELVPLGIFLAGAGFCLALVLCLCEELLRPSITQSQPIMHQDQMDPAKLKYLYKLSAQLVLLLSLVVLLDLVTHKSALVTVPLVSLSAPFFLAVVLRRTAIYYQKFHTYFTVSLPKMYNEMILFSAIGFFGYALGMSEEVSRFILALVSHLGFTSPFTIIPLVMSLVTGVGVLGIHPIVTISTIAVTLPPETLGLSSLQMAGALLTGYMLYSLLSPFSGTAMVLAAVTKTSNLDMSMKLNLVYGLLFAVMTTLLLVWLV